MFTTYRARRLWLFLAIALSIAVIGGVAIKQAMAQEDDNAAAKEGAAKDDGGAKAAPKKEEKSRIMWFIYTVGLIGGFIFLLSIYFVSHVGRMFVELRPQVASPPEIIDEIEGMLQQRQFKEIYNVVKDDNSFFSRVVSTGIAELPNGLAEARDVMERVGESLTVEMEKKISIFAVLGTLGPMIGLLGTLKGMIASFGEIAYSGTQLKADKVAEGISEALLLTFLGVGLSVPAIYFFALFRNRVSYISVNTMLSADEFLRHFAHAARSKAPAGAPAAAAAGAAKPAAKA